MKIKCLFLIFIVFAFIDTNPIFAQSVNGRITDAKNNPLQFAEIQLLNAVQIAISDSNGNFHFNLQDGVYVLSSTSLGYVPSIDTLIVKNGSGEIHIILNESDFELEETMVTATKSEERVVAAPFSLSIISSKKINDANIRDISQLSGWIPNLQYGNLGVAYQQQISIRGISVFSETPSVATYVDGVIALDIAANGLQFLDIDRIEVLRGAQGTLYGRNAMGGVINIITKKPGNNFSAFVESSIGNQGLQRYGFGLKGPLIKNKLFSGFSGQFQKIHGFYTNDLSDKTTFSGEPLAGTLEDGARLGDEASFYGNFYLKYLPSEKINITYNSKIQYDKSIGPSAYYQAVENNISAITTPYKFAVNSLGSNSRLLANQAISVVYDHSRFRFFSTSTHQVVLQSYKGIDQDLFPYNLSTGASFRNKIGDAYPQNVFSQEFRFSSPANIHKIKWTAGAYFFYQKYDKRYASVYEDLALLFGLKPGIEVIQTDQNNLGSSVFSQTDFTKGRFTFTAGLRMDFEMRKTNIFRYYFKENNEKDYSIYDVHLHSDFFSVSPKAAIKFSIADNQQTYFSYSRGFRAGGNNMFTNGKYPTYQPEYSNNWELGYKFRSKPNNISLSTTLFFLHWKNMQLDMQPEPGIWIVDNIGVLYSFGLETEANIKIFKGFEIDFSLGLNRSRYGNFIFLKENIKGNNAIMSPKYTLLAAVQQSFDINKETRIVFRAEYKSFGKQYFDLVNSIEQSPYHLLNMNSSFQYKFFKISFWMQNITNSVYLTYAMPGYFKYSLVNRPRTFGTTIQIKF